MQDVDGPPHVQSLPEPTRTPRPCVDSQALRVVTRAEGRNGVLGDRCRRRYVGKRASVRPPELERPVGQPRNLITLLVHRSVMPAAEQREVRERGRAPVRPVAEMMPLGEAQAASREAAALVPMVEGTA